MSSIPVVYGTTIDWDIFMLIIIRVKIFRGVKFLQFAQSATFFNSGQLHCGRTFLVFSLLPGIRRARYWESQVSLDVYSPRLDIYLGGCRLARTFIHESSPRKFFFFFFSCLIFMVGLNRKIILRAKFSRSTVDGV